MVIFEAAIQHDPKTFESLARMRYDLFCKRNRMIRTMFSLGLLFLGIANSESWWGIAAIGCGCYLSTSTYNSANYTANKLEKQIRISGMDFPSSRYEFTEEGMQIIILPENNPFGEPLPYGNFCQLGEDRSHFYIFRDSYGGYMIPKQDLDEDDFRDFIQKKTGLRFQKKMAPFATLMQKIKEHESEPYHL